MTRSEFNAICFACGLLLLGYGADSVAHWRSRQPSDRYARSDSIFFALAEASSTAVTGAVTLHPDTTTVVAAAAGTTGPSRARADARIDLNTASHAQLVTLPGIGPALASRIIESRERLGPFERVVDLQRVPGIGPAKTSRISDLVVASN
ncbi:MAG: ComEA family DNA-binding protein [Rhodothermia bacterium]|nr:ComEA family DNA-binding protein [Rhodothermia bacterium]